MSWVVLNENYAVNSSTKTIVRRALQTTGITDDEYTVCDDPLTRSSNRGVQFASFDERVRAGYRGGTERVILPHGMEFEDALETVRFYGMI